MKLVQLPGCSVEPSEELVTGPPYIEHTFHVAHLVKPLIQADHAGDIVGVSAALQEPAAHGSVVRIGFFELEPRLAEAERDTDRLPVIHEIRLGPRLGESEQVEYGFFLVLRPEALALDIGATGGEDVDADDREPHQHRDDHQEWRHDEEHALAVGKPARGLCSRNPKRFFHHDSPVPLVTATSTPRLALKPTSAWRRARAALQRFLSLTSYARMFQSLSRLALYGASPVPGCPQHRLFRRSGAQYLRSAACAAERRNVDF